MLREAAQGDYSYRAATTMRFTIYKVHTTYEFTIKRKGQRLKIQGYGSNSNNSIRMDRLSFYLLSRLVAAVVFSF